MRFGEDIQGVIFDIDGVLLDSMEIWTDLGVRYILSKGGTPEKCLSDILFSMSMEEGAVYIRDHYLPDETEEEILLGLQHMLRDFYYDEVQAKSGAEILISFMKEKGLKITAATWTELEITFQLETTITTIINSRFGFFIFRSYIRLC